jgi:hypothetical protein
VRLRLYRDRGAGFEPSRSLAFPVSVAPQLIEALQAAQAKTEV